MYKLHIKQTLAFASEMLAANQVKGDQSSTHYSRYSDSRILDLVSLAEFWIAGNLGGWTDKCPCAPN